MLKYVAGSLVPAARDLPRRIRAVAIHAVPPRVRARLLPGGAIRLDRTRWNSDYAGGYGAVLGGLPERPRYSVIAGYCGALGGRSVLDVGCGTGVLQAHLRPLGYDHYVGVDLSDRAINLARRNAPDSARFEVADASDYQPDRRFDVTILNEMLYYFDNPERLLARYARALEPDGAFIVSMWEMSQSWRTWWRCAGHLDLLDETVVGRGNNFNWHVRLCRPRPSALAA